MNKDNLQYAFETQQSINDRNTDIIGTLTTEITALRSKIQEKENTIAALGATNRKLKNDLDKCMDKIHSDDVETANIEKNFKNFIGESTNN
ncbi:hypothetical protein AKH19_00935 [Pelagibacteraceae bacterium GOM-A1]|nr:hypothetical protein AKH19_00935 [Pelagibacteraceae bacterium GOM-A1]